MKDWLGKLKKAELKYFNEDESLEVVNYYEKIINERVDQGDIFENVLSS